MTATYSVAALYQAVKRNYERFEDEYFMFELSHEEILRCQIGTSNCDRLKNLTISTALAELQARPADAKTRKPIGFIQPKDEDKE